MQAPRREIDGERDPEVRAAGGVIVDRSGPEPSVAIVHRPRYDDWSLPKGKLEPGEAWEQAALREVLEETGYRCVLGRELDPAAYEDHKGRSKLVRWWEMSVEGGAFEANDEVDELVWVGIDAAAERLSHDSDRSLLEALRR